MLGKLNAQVSNALGSISASVDNHEAKVVTARAPASAYLTLNSRDRLFNASPTQTSVTYQPWNNFILQKAEAIIPTFARRLAITEVRFPWFIPNITKNNSQFGLILATAPAPTVLRIKIPGDEFYTPTELAAAINAAIATAANLLPPGTAPTCVYGNGQFIFARGSVPGTAFALVALNDQPVGLGPITANNIITSSLAYETSPNLLTTIGMPFEYLTLSLAAPVFLPAAVGGNYSLGLYTEFVDIVSDRLMRFADARDGGSGQLARTSNVMRLYLADEVSLTTLDASGEIVPVGSRPFIIHRQFATPKQVQWDSKSFVGDLDLQVYDQYGAPVYLQFNAAAGRPYSYPDYQITLLASEN